MSAIPQKTTRASGKATAQGAPVNTRLAVLETRWEDVVPTLATKADLGRMEASITRWMLTTTIALMVGFGGMFFALQRNLDTALTRIERLYVPDRTVAIAAPEMLAPQD